MYNSYQKDMEDQKYSLLGQLTTFTSRKRSFKKGHSPNNLILSILWLDDKELWGTTIQIVNESNYKSISIKVDNSAAMYSINRKPEALNLY
jgi:hypothetical protein